MNDPALSAAIKALTKRYVLDHSAAELELFDVLWERLYVGDIPAPHPVSSWQRLARRLLSGLGIGDETPLPADSLQVIFTMKVAVADLCAGSAVPTLQQVQVVIEHAANSFGNSQAQARALGERLGASLHAILNQFRNQPQAAPSVPIEPLPAEASAVSLHRHQDGEARIVAKAERFYMWLSTEEVPRADEKALLTAKQLATYSHPDNYTIFLDCGILWIKPERGARSSQVRTLSPINKKLLAILLRLRPRAADVKELYVKLTGIPSVPVGMEESDILSEYLSATISRFRTAMKEHLSEDVFFVPDKGSAPGYCCGGRFSSCVIVPAGEEEEYRVLPAR